MASEKPISQYQDIPKQLSEMIEKQCTYRMPRPKNLTIMTCDASGSTRLTPEGQARLKRILPNFVATIVKIHQGILLSYEGDGVVAYFDVDHSHWGNYSVQAVRASYLIADQFHLIDANLPEEDQGRTFLVCGIATGETSFIEVGVGEKDKKGIALIGDVIVRAKSLGSSRKNKYTTLIDRETRKRLYPCIGKAELEFCKTADCENCTKETIPSSKDWEKASVKDKHGRENECFASRMTTSTMSDISGFDPSALDEDSSDDCSSDVFSDNLGEESIEES